MKLIKFKDGEGDVYINPDAIIAVKPSTLFVDRTIITLNSGDVEFVSSPLENVIDILSKNKLDNIESEE